MKEVIFAPNAPAAIGPYCHAEKCGNFVFTSGQLGLIPETGKLAEGGAAEEARQSLKNLSNVLQAAGMTMDDVIKCTVLLADIADFKAVNVVYAEVFGDNRPARTCYQVGALPAGAAIEIEAIAYKE